MTTRQAQLRQTRQESRERILAAVAELVRTTSYGALTVDDVMRTAGASRTIFYRHFDDLADLLMRAARDAFGELLEAEQSLARAREDDGLDLVRAAIEPAVAAYERHGPLMRAIAEAAASGDEQVNAGLRAWRERFVDLVADLLRDTPRFSGRPPEEVVEAARALNLMNESYLLDAFGRARPRVSADTAVRTLTEVWRALVDAPPPPLPPAAKSDAYDVRSTRVKKLIPAPRRRVYETLIDPAAIARWKVPAGMTCEVHEFDAREGGAIRVSLIYDAPDRNGKTVGRTDTYRGRLVRLVPYELVVEADEFETDDPDMRGEMTSTISLADADGGGTVLTAVHDGLPPGLSAADNEIGWRESLERLAALLRQ